MGEFENKLDMESLKPMIGDIKRSLGDRRGERAARDVAKVFFGLQPGDDISYCSWEGSFFGALRALSEMNPEFGFEDGIIYRRNRKLVVVHNNLLISKIEDVFGQRNFIATYKKLRQNKRYKKASHHRLAGRFFGFPECCIDSFTEKRSRYKESRHPYLEYIEHVPCNPDCKESEILGKRYKPVVEFVRSI